MKLFKLNYILGLILLASCSDQPTKLTEKTVTIEVTYINWACDCADFIEVKYYNDNPDYVAKEEDCIFIEPANNDKKIPEEYYENGHFEYYLRLTGQFYKDKGIPNSYDRKTVGNLGKPKKSRVFRYYNFELVKHE